MEELFGSIFDDAANNLVEENLTYDILQEQARLIKTKTNGLIKCTFSLIEHKASAYGAFKTMSILSATLAKSGISQEEVLDDELVGKEDINSLTKERSYKFELYNDNYRFRIFTFKYCELFPVYMCVDEGIREELNLSKEIKIDSNQDLKDVFIKVFKSKKLSSIITKMMNESKYDEKALVFLRENGASTVSEIAKGIAVSNSTMYRIIKELEASEKISKNDKNKWIVKHKES